MLLEPFNHPYLGPLKNRIVMSAMTRNFADPGHRATEQIADYYARRAESGVALILTEGVIVHLSGDGYNNVPHMQTGGQAESWAKVVRRVHAAGSKILCQLWHCGRISHSDYTGGQPPVSSTDRAAEGINRQNNKPFGVPRALAASELPDIYEMYVHSGRLALSAGFDGVELHLGHGYLADQFLDARINDRTDDYGGSVENRCRFALELVRTVLGKIPADKVMVRISPSREMNGLYDWPDLEAMLAYLIPQLESAGLRMLDISNARAEYFKTSGRIIRSVRPRWPHPLIGGASLSLEQAETELRKGLLDMITWGRFLIANPDLAKRFVEGQPLVPMANEMLKQLV